MNFWDKQLVIPVRESTDAQFKHLLVKSLLVLAIKLKYAKHLLHQSIFSEFEIENKQGKLNVVDVYHEDRRLKAIYCYEVQENLGEEYIIEKNNFYQNHSQYGFNTVDWVLVKLKDCPDDLDKCWEWVKLQVR